MRQYDRYQQEVSNAKVPFGILVETSALTTEQKKTLTQIYSKQNWSNRVQIKIIRLARTISDLAGEERIAEQVIWEAMTLRRRGQNKQMTIAREK
ncbi:Mg chelatase-like protein [Mycobacteroides abscessus subsp. abscessus]|nr:Mg chelatase-like protein [Mycobacteroides abscessus subsp. abscessus]